MSSSLPYMKSPCANCPFRKDTQKGWLGASRMKEISQSGSFVCHKNTAKQCAGHMIMVGESNTFVQLASRLGIPVHHEGKELVFETIEACVKHHAH